MTKRITALWHRLPTSGKKLLGITLFLLGLYIALRFADPAASSGQNHYNLGKRIGLNGIISLGVGLLIIAGGIDLSIGSVVGLCAVLTATLLSTDYGWSPIEVIPAVLGVGVAIGLAHGLLITRLRIQPFVVTLCGLFLYRGVARWFAEERVRGVPHEYQYLKDFLSRQDVFGVPRLFVIFLILAAVAAVFLHFSIYGRYFYAIGSNEKAARYSGIPTNRYRILAYVICSTLAAFYGILHPMEYPSAQPTSTGQYLELYAIAGAVLGGCSLRGGEGTVLGIMLGTTILWILPNFTTMWGIKDELQLTVIGGALLLAAILDEVLRPKSTGRLN